MAIADKYDLAKELDKQLEELMSSGGSGSGLYGSVPPWQMLPLGGPSHTHSIPTPPQLPLSPSNWEMLCMRMRWQPYSGTDSFHYITVHPAGEKMYVWLITKGEFEPITLEDDLAMYPSDMLITKLRMIEKGEASGG